MSDVTGKLSTLIVEEVSRPIAPAAQALSDHLRATYGDNALAVLYYGSCLRTGKIDDGILDIFVIVDNYRDAFDNRVSAIANYLLPPNVFYLEMPFGDLTVRTKYAVISLDQFIHRTSRRCFHTFFWARFAQPCALTYVRDEQIKKRLVAALVHAIETFIGRALPLLPAKLDVITLWSRSLSASYATELRPEPAGASASLVAANLERYETVTALLAKQLSELSCDEASGTANKYAAQISRSRRLTARAAWRLRRIQGKAINLARIMKAAFTFDGGVDYVLWKIERHSGVKIEASPMLRRHPLLACWPTVWRLYRAGAFR